MTKMNDLSTDQARLMVHHCFGDLVAETDGGIMLETADPHMEREWQRFCSQEQILQLRSEIETGSYGAEVKVAAGQTLAVAGHQFSTLTSTARTLIQEGIARALIEQQRLFQLRLDDRLAPFVPQDSLFDCASLTGGSAVLSAHKKCDTPTIGLTLGAAIESFLSQGKKRWRPKTVASRASRLRFLEDHLGKDRPIASISENDVRSYRDAVRRLRRLTGRIVPLSFSERQTENPNHRIATKTATLIFEVAKAFFRWCKNDEGLIASNPATDISMPKEEVVKQKRSRRPFKADEIAILFSSPFFTGHKSKHRRYVQGNVITRDARFWLPILAYYGGARLGELVQLQLRDLHVDGTIPRYSVNEEGCEQEPGLKHVKSLAGIREVPIHPDVIALGFGNFVAARRKRGKPIDRLFQEIEYGKDGQASTTYSKLFGRIMDQCGLGDPTLVFHSFRHNAEDAFREAKQPQYVIDKIIGHSDPTTSGGYGEGVGIETAYEAVQAMQLPLSLLTVVPH